MKSFLDNVQQSCINYGRGGLWNSVFINCGNMISVDMIACYPGSFLGYGECAEYFKRFGHPTKLMRVAVNGPLPVFDLTGFACVESFKFTPGLHPINFAWCGRYFHQMK